MAAKVRTQTAPPRVDGVGGRQLTVDDAALREIYAEMTRAGVDFRDMRPVFSPPEEFALEYTDSRTGRRTRETCGFIVDYARKRIKLNRNRYGDLGEEGHRVRVDIADALKATELVDDAVSGVGRMLSDINVRAGLCGWRRVKFDPRPREIRLGSRGELAVGQSVEQVPAEARLDTVKRQLILPESALSAAPDSLREKCRHECTHAAQYNILSGAEAGRMDSLLEAGAGIDVLEGGVSYLTEPASRSLLSDVEQYIRARKRTAGETARSPKLDNKLFGFFAANADHPRYFGAMMFSKIEQAQGAETARRKVFELLRETARHGQPGEEVSHLLYREYAESCTLLREEPLTPNDVRLASAEARLLQAQDAIDARMQVATEEMAITLLTAARDFIILGGRPSGGAFANVRSDVDQDGFVSRLTYAGRVEDAKGGAPAVSLK